MQPDPLSCVGCGDRACYDYDNMLPNKNSQIIARLISHKYFPLVALLFANLLAGLLTVKDYGASWDDPKRYAYATNSLKAYLGKAGDLADDKGPFYVMAARVGTEILVRLDKNWSTMDAWHWMHFLTFQLSLIFLYVLCLRLMKRWAALCTTLLFSTQPLLWGHAFINSKDIPFMSFFLGSVAIGLGMADALHCVPSYTSLFKPVWFRRVREWLQPGGFGPPVRSAAGLSRTQVRGMTPAVQPVNFKPLFARFAALFSEKWIWFAGVGWGLTSSIRVLGPAAGILVAIYFVRKSGRKAIPPLLASFAIAGVVTYLSWPGLWGSPITKFMQSFSESSDFPWEGKVLFNGVGYRPDELPSSYLPTLMGIQLSEPLLALFAGGMAVGAIKLFRKQIDPEMSWILLAWLFLPIAGVLVLKPRLYDNFRHFLFILPPVFIFAGVGIQSMFDWIRKPLLYIAIITALVTPNIYWILQLHPYEYTYYNSFVGGVGGAFRRFETDYWTTSYREVVEYLNQVAPQNAKVIVWGPANVAAYYARPDLRVVEYSKKQSINAHPATYAILSTRQDKDLKLYSHAPQIFQVSREEAIFTVAKQLTP